MKFCSQCGAANEDTMFICYSCGAELEAQQINTGKKRGLKIPKPVLTITGIVLSAALVVSGIVLAVSSVGGSMSKAVNRTAKALGGNKENLTQVERFYSVASDRLSKGEYTMNATFSGGTVDLQIQMDYSRPEKQLRGEIVLNGYDVEYSAKKDIVQIHFPGEYEIYGFDVKDINKVTKKINEYLNKPLLKSLFPRQLPTDLKIDFFKKTDLKDSFDSIAGEEFDAFCKSLKVEKWNDETILRGGKTEVCWVYKVSWKSEALRKFLGALGSGGYLPNVGDWLNALLPELDPYLYCYINQEHYVVGIRFATAGNKCQILLEGEENPWDKIVLTVETMTGEIKAYEGARDRYGETFELYLKNAAGDKQFAVSYDNESGEFDVWTARMGSLLTGKINCKKEESSIKINWRTPEFGLQTLFWSITDLQNKPDQLGEKYSDLKEIGWQIFGNIIHDALTN